MKQNNTGLTGCFIIGLISLVSLLYAFINDPMTNAFIALMSSITFLAIFYYKDEDK